MCIISISTTSHGKVWLPTSACLFMRIPHILPQTPHLKLLVCLYSAVEEWLFSLAPLQLHFVRISACSCFSSWSSCLYCLRSEHEQCIEHAVFLMLSLIHLFIFYGASILVLLPSEHCWFSQNCCFCRQSFIRCLLFSPHHSSSLVSFSHLGQSLSWFSLSHRVHPISSSRLSLHQCPCSSSVSCYFVLQLLFEGHNYSGRFNFFTPSLGWSLHF